jgi:TPR repeat protein
MKRALLLVALLCSLSWTAGAQDFKKGADAYKRGDYATALRVWRPLAEQGGVGAQFFLGIMHFMGQGVPRNDAEAVKWWRVCSEQGNRNCQYHFAVMYQSGSGIPQDHAEAYIWYSLAAAGGFERAPERRDQLAARLTPDQLRAAQGEAKKRWKRIQARKK